MAGLTVLKSTPNDRYFEKHFMAVFIYSQSFCQKSAERKSSTEILYKLRFIGDISPWALNRGLRVFARNLLREKLARKYFFILKIVKMTINREICKLWPQGSRKVKSNFLIKRFALFVNQIFIRKNKIKIKIINESTTKCVNK